MIPLVLLMGVGMHTAWRSQKPGALIKTLKIPALIAVVAGLLVPFIFYGRLGLLMAIGSIAGFWIMGVSLVTPLRAWRRDPGTSGITRSTFGMCVAHFGVGMFVIGVTIVSAFSVEADRSLRIGESATVAGYDFELRGMRNVEGPNYRAIEGEIDIYREGKFVAQVRPQKRTYIVQQSPMTEAGIHVGLTGDLFAALGEPLGDNAWSVRLQYKPMIRFIWIGAFVMALGGLIAASDRRYRLVAVAAEKAPALKVKPA